MTNYNAPNDTLARYDDTFQEAAQQLAGYGHEVTIAEDSRLSQQMAADDFDVLRAGRKDAAGFQPIELLANTIPNTPQLLGRIILMPNVEIQAVSPAVIMPVPGSATKIRITRLNQPFVPRSGLVGNNKTGGLTDGIRFVLATDVQTNSSAFGGHGTGMGQVEGGHLGVALTTAVSTANAEALRARGDALSDQIIGGGITQEFGRLGMVEGSVVPTTRVIDTATLPPGTKLPLYYHDQLDSENGPAMAEYPGAARLVLGAALNHVGSAGLQTAARNIETVTRR